MITTKGLVPLLQQGPPVQLIDVLGGEATLARALDARADARLVGHFEASPDHATTLAFPEGSYLKGLLLQKAG